MSHHCLIRAIIERELTRQHVGTWDDFFKLKIVGPQRGGPKGKGIGTREKIIVGVRKVVYKIVQEALASVSTSKTTKKRIPSSESSTSKKRKAHIDTIGKVSKEEPPVP